MKKNSKKNITYIFLIVVLVFISIIFADRSYRLKKYESLSYKETIATSYRVYLDDDSYYNTPYLDEGMQYISNIIDYVDVTFSYINSFADSLTYNAETKAEAIVTIVDTDDNNKVIYKNTEVIENTKKDSDTSGTINKVKNFKIDYAKYNKITNEFKTKYGISAKCNLRINYYVNYTGKYKGLNNISRNTVMYLDIPLSEQMINITKNAPAINNSSFDGTSSNTATNTILYVLAIICDLIALVFLFKVVSNKIAVSKETSKYDKFINKTLKQYDSYITEAEHETTNKENMVRISTFRELLDVRNNINKTIVYIRIDDNTSKFEIIDGNTLYYYVANREDFN
ncbi:putative uncharacterized protein [Clostridium sp. CAG:433]|nr:putative uncharacterized protein [Clostridium sp. CAG:433]